VVGFRGGLGGGAEMAAGFWRLAVDKFRNEKGSKASLGEKG